MLLLLCAALSASPGPAIGSPRLNRGDELVYRGQVIEASDRIDNRFRKTADLEVRVFVLESVPGHADCAVMTVVRPRNDPIIAGAAAAVTGNKSAQQTPLPPAVQLELIRVDGRGRVMVLQPPPGPPPIPLSNTTPVIEPPATPLDGPPLLELGMFVPLPAKPVGVGEVWTTTNPHRPVTNWTAERDAVWNGGRMITLSVVQQTDGWDRPDIARTGWRRTDTVLTAPADGYATGVVRKIERRDGPNVTDWVEVRYELTPPLRHVGTKYMDIRREAETALWFADDLAKYLPKVGKADPREFQSRLIKIDRYLADNPTPTGFRDAVEAVKRRGMAAVRGEAAPVVVPVSHTTSAEPLVLGKLAPDFVAPLVAGSGTVRLSGLRGKPAVVVFFKPGSNTARATMLVAEALHAQFPDKASVVAVAVAAPPADAVKQKADMKLTVPVADGTGVRDRYGIDTYPRWFVVDAAGTLLWRFDGFGLETGYLVKEQVEKLLSSAAENPR